MPPRGCSSRKRQLLIHFHPCASISDTLIHFWWVSRFTSEVTTVSYRPRGSPVSGRPSSSRRITFSPPGSPDSPPTTGPLRHRPSDLRPEETRTDPRIRPPSLSVRSPPTDTTPSGADNPRPTAPLTADWRTRRVTPISRPKGRPDGQDSTQGQKVYQTGDGKHISRRVRFLIHFRSCVLQ